MLTKEQKKKQVELAADLIKKSRVLLFADFTGVDTASIRKLKTDIKKSGAIFKVIKKRLLNIALKNLSADYDPLQFTAQVGTFFIAEDLSSVAAPIYKFAKDLAKSKKEFKILGGYDVANKAAILPEEFVTVAKLPSRETLLAMVMGAMTGPLRAFMYITDQLSKRPAAEAAVSGEKVATS